MELIETMLFLNDVEATLLQEAKQFEAEVYSRWNRLPPLTANTIYHMCPYFDGIENYFKTGLSRIADRACREYQTFTGESKDLSWHQFQTFNGESKDSSWHLIYNDYEEVINELCLPYIDAFEAVASKGMDRLRATRAKLENTSSGRIHGYITNSLGFALAYETINAISGALKAVENDNAAWQSATEPQKLIHNKLSAVWSEKFSSVFMERIRMENKSFVAAIIKNFCQSFGYTYESYLKEKDTSVFVDALQKHQASKKKAQEQKQQSKEEKKKSYLKGLHEQVAAKEAELSSIGFALWGEKAERKKLLQKQIEQLQLEIHAIEHPIRIQTTYAIRTPENSPLFNILFKGYDKWYENNNKQYWRFEYSEQYNDYVAYTPENKPLFALGQGFVQKYGRYRKIGAKFEGCPNSGIQFEWSLFEIKD